MNINIADVSKSFGRQNILRKINISITGGSILGLLGPSGSGKTTLIRLILGAIKADSGTIHIGDISVPNIKYLKNIGYMPQNDAIYPDLTGEENLAFFGRLQGLNGKVLQKRMNELFEMIELNNDRKKLVQLYSGGMRKRLSLAAAIIHKPKILLLDEPTVGVDPILRRKIWVDFRRMANEGCAILITTHVMDEISECDSAALIYNGSLIAHNSVETLLKSTVSGRVEDIFFDSISGDKL